MFGQLQLLSIPGPGLEEPVGDLLNMGEAPAGEQVEVPLRIRNTGAATITLERLRVTGIGFFLRANPTLPFIIAPGGNVDFRVRFAPSGHGSYSGTLRFNDNYVVLLASAAASLSLSVDEGGLFEEVTAGVPVIFGRVRQGVTAVRSFALLNPSHQGLDLELLSLEGSEFLLQGAPSLPATIGPGQSVTFEVTFAPSSSGVRQTVLDVNDRRFIMEGVGLDPPFPALEILLESNALVSGEQSSLRIRLTEPAPAAGTGQLQMSFLPALSDAGDDPGVLFVNGQRTMTLTVEKGEREARFEGEQAAWFQTGTTAGEIRFAAALGDQTREAAVTLPPAPAVIDTATWSRTDTGIALRITGFDNTLNVESVSFQFHNRNKTKLTARPIIASVANEFRGHYSRTQIGGLFALTAEFPVAGDVSLLGAVDVQFTNTVGPGAEHRIEFR